MSAHSFIAVVLHPRRRYIWSRLRLQELNEGFLRGVRDVVLHPLGIGFGGLSGDTQRKEDIHDQPVTCSHAFGECLSGFRQKHAAIGARRCDSPASAARWF
jgi:hypothetical protein